MMFEKSERETVLVFEEETGEWMVYSTIGKHIRKLSSLCDNLTVLESEDGRPTAIKGTLKEKQVSMNKERAKRPMTEEQRQKAAERLAKARASNN